MSIRMDVDTQELRAVELTGNDEADAPVAKRILEGKTNNAESCSGDGAYDDFCFRKLRGDTIRQIIPPPKNAVIHPERENAPDEGYLKQRNDAVKSIHETGRDEWKEQSGYHQRSLHEVVMYRYKTIFGEKLNLEPVHTTQSDTNAGKPNKSGKHTVKFVIPRTHRSKTFYPAKKPFYLIPPFI